MKITIDTLNKTIEVIDEIPINQLLTELNKYIPEYEKFSIVSRKEMIQPLQPPPWNPMDTKPYWELFNTKSSDGTGE